MKFFKRNIKCFFCHNLLPDEPFKIEFRYNRGISSVDICEECANTINNEMGPEVGESHGED